MRILIVDDSESFLNALMAILNEGGYPDVVKKQSASEAIQYLRDHNEHPGEFPIDLILMDIMMPEMDGIAAVQAIKSNEKLRDLPIMMISIRDEEDKIHQAFQAGAIDYIEKPIKKLELRARIRSFLRLKEEIDQRKAHERQLEKTVQKLQKAVSEIHTLTGLLPICSNCKKIRNDKGYWEQVESYVSERTSVEFTHGLCPDCIKSLYPEIAHRVITQMKDPDPNHSVR
ncbi:MAG: response regulator [Candidatus Omnitrophota bacterium]